jgi:phosphoribosylaminoimidazolecarboxamide formyltransferase/IMP cyclohydrolase
MEEVKSLGIAPVDMVVCNLYQFTETAGRPSATMDDIIEEIDIGGVTLLRAAAKNYESVTVVCDPKRYDAIVQELETNGDVRFGYPKTTGA